MLLGKRTKRRRHGAGKVLNDGSQGRKAARAAADRFAANIRQVIDELRADGAVTTRAIADELNMRGLRTRRGGAWEPVSVRRVMRRCAT